jgi:hypothetical protein
LGKGIGGSALRFDYLPLLSVSLFSSESVPKDSLSVDDIFYSSESGSVLKASLLLLE